MGSFSMSVDASAEPAQGTVLRFHGPLTLADAQRLWDAMGRATATLGRGGVARLDVSDVSQADGAAVAVLLQARAELEARGVTTELVGAQGSLAALLRVYRGATSGLRASTPRSPAAFIGRIGRAAWRALRELQLWLGFVGGLAVASVAAARRPGTVSWRDVPHLMERLGATALPIVLVVNFLIGIITAYQFGVALKQFGATIYVPDLVCLAVTRELAPLMTAIVIAGRSGSAVAAELGSMAVSDEIDALRALHLDPLRFLVVPRVVALVLTLPLLTVVGDALGMLGGLAVAIISLDMSALGYFTEARAEVSASDVSFGVGKSVVFAVIIALVACQQGLVASGGASGVGRRTTSAVVSILFSIIAVDAIFAPHQ
ncbi:MAG TPA: ABC transporter permease [Polyangiaceae bacterium]|nr:ABC transporter permease [Polyangiaceae bacterium]